MSEPDGYLPVDSRDKTIWNISEINYPETFTKFTFLALVMDVKSVEPRIKRKIETRCFSNDNITVIVITFQTLNV